MFISEYLFYNFLSTEYLNHDFLSAEICRYVLHNNEMFWKHNNSHFMKRRASGPYDSVSVEILFSIFTSISCY